MVETPWRKAAGRLRETLKGSESPREEESEREHLSGVGRGEKTLGSGPARGEGREGSREPIRLLLPRQEDSERQANPRRGSRREPQGDRRQLEQDLNL